MATFNFKKITLPNGDVGTVYDASAQTGLSGLSSNLSSNSYKFLTYKGNTLTEAQIKALTSAKVGDFYLASDDGTAYICITAISGTASESSWEKAGSSTDVSKFVIAEDTTGEITETVAGTWDGHTVADFVLKTEVVDNLTSTSNNVPLSAAQGKVLNDSLTTVSTDLDAAEGNISTLQTDLGTVEGNVTTLQTDLDTAEGNISTLQTNMTTANTNITNLSNNKVNKSGGTMTGILTAYNNTSYTTKQVRNIFVSTSSPSGGSYGDIWIKYTS